MESIRNLLKISKNSAYTLILIVSTSYAGGEANSISNQKTSSDLYGSYSLSLGQLDWDKGTAFLNRRPTLYRPMSIDVWVGKKLSHDTEGIIVSCYRSRRCRRGYRLCNKLNYHLRRHPQQRCRRRNQLLT